MSATAEPGDWIAVDWGTTRMRARLVSLNGDIRTEAPLGPGMGALDAGQYEPALVRAVEPWLNSLDGSIDVLVCGMAGARTGWREAPYRPLPARLDGLLAHAVEPPVSDPRLRVRIVPGLCRMGDRPDVMRGEETQLLGLLATEKLGDALVLMPGTHSKRVTLRDGTVIDFATAMTGEVYALLRGSTLAGALGDGWYPAAFTMGLDRGLAGEALDRLFAHRAGFLLGETDADENGAHLSGLLIGAELRALPPEPRVVHVVGEGALAERYGKALRHLGREPVMHHGGRLAVAGLHAMRIESGPARDGWAGGGTS